MIHLSVFLLFFHYCFLNIPSSVFNNLSCYCLSACHLIFLKVVIVFIWRSFVLNYELLSNGHMICFLKSSRDNILRPFSLILPNSVNLSRMNDYSHINSQGTYYSAYKQQHRALISWSSQPHVVREKRVDVGIW